MKVQMDKERAADKPRRTRSDTKMKPVLEAAMEVFRTSGVSAPVREIAERAGVGLGTIYRNFPQRSDLIIAVFQSQVDSCADTASDMAKKYKPGEALDRWIERYTAFIETKRGLAEALHSGDPAYAALSCYFEERLEPALNRLLEAAVEAGEIRAAINARELLPAVATLCRGVHGEEPAYARKLIALLMAGLRQEPKKPSRK